MPTDIMMNYRLADEPPFKIDKMESIFMRSDSIKNIKSMNIDEEKIMKSINNQQHSENTNQNNFDESDRIFFGMQPPVGFSVATNVPSAQN